MLHLPSALRLAALLFVLTTALPSEAVHRGEKDPRNWPTIERIISERFESAGDIHTLRVYARQSENFNCGYRHAHGALTAFTLLGGPLETMTGYISKDLGELLARELEKDPWLPVTVQVRFDPERLSEACPDQVDILKYSIGWEYPAGSLSPRRPDTSYQPSASTISESNQEDMWRIFSGKLAKRRYDRAGQIIPPPTEAALLGTEIELLAGARLSRSYHCVYRGMTRSHYAIRFHDGQARFIHGYLPRTPETQKLMDTIALQRDVLMKVKARLVKHTPSNYCMPQLEVSSWSFPNPTTAE